MPEFPSDQAIFRNLDAAGRQLVGSFQALTNAQRAAIPAILERRPVLLVARTASGKTEAVLAPLLTIARRESWKALPSILYVAPTRALVNDLHRRLQETLEGYVSVGRRTGESRNPDCEFLITTPESLDSMLARGCSRSGHLLAGVRKIVLDELHVLAGSARGAQLQVLLERLDEVTRSPLFRVAISATVPGPADMARRFLGPGAQVRAVGGSRPLRVIRAGGAGPLPERGTGIDPLAGQILRAADESDGPDPMAEALLAERAQHGKLKALVFVPTRARCDGLTAALTRSFHGRCPVMVRAHHGSLDQRQRESTEEALARAEESVAVATATLEVGIDVGDVGLVVLDGPPGSVASLLQRVGRGGRRTDEIRVLPLARDDVAAVTIASMLRAAIEGDLDPIPDTAHFSVALQQLASILYQAPRARRKRDAIIALLGAAFGSHAGPLVAQLVAGGIVEVTDQLLLGPSPPLRQVMDSPMRLHGNIGASGAVVPLVDAMTGDRIAWVPRGGADGRIVVAGAAYNAESFGDHVELRMKRTGGRGKAVRYANRGAPVGRDALRHLAIGLGLGDAALVQQDDEWIHFGGALAGRLITLAGVDSGPLSAKSDPRALVGSDLPAVVEKNWRHLESLCGFGPFHADLPEDSRRAAVIETMQAHDFGAWLSRLEVAATVSYEQARILEQA